jgi:hypothetical protein|tara:strand:+ start:4699 stop:4821 length:123 start_codon:yes stop_codon:yes gene_type:complete
MPGVLDPKTKKVRQFGYDKKGKRQAEDYAKKIGGEIKKKK